MQTHLYELLRQCTVRLEVSGKTTVYGTGFFIAPGLILTCAHVLKHAQTSLPKIIIYCGRQPFEVTQITKPELDQDLMLVYVNLKGHPCVYLHEEATPFDGLYSYGYPKGDPDGDPVTFALEGKVGEQEGGLKFKGGQVIGGMSGAPLLNTATGYVCGIVDRTRDSSKDLGGRAIPTSAVFHAFPDIAALQQEFHQQDHQWAILVEQYLASKPIETKLASIEVVSQLVHADTGQIIDGLQELKESQEKTFSRLSSQSMQRSGPPFILPPPKRVPDFTGRAEELEQLRQLLLPSDGSHTGRIAGLVGTGGMGKSTLACQFAITHKEHFPDGVIGLRIGQEDVDILAQKFADQAGIEVDLRKKPRATEIMQKVFGDRQALLIFDNAEDGRVQDLLPSGQKCAVIVTTRDRNVLRSANIADPAYIDLEGFTLGETEELFTRLLGEHRVKAELGSVGEIHRLVGGLPLALRIICGMLAYEKSTTLKEYVARLDKKKQQLTSYLQNRGNSEMDVYASFNLSLESLKEEEKTLFACLGACAPEGFSLMTAQATSNMNKDAVAECMGYLFRLSLVSQNPVGDRYFFHPLLFNFACEQAEKKGVLKIAEQRHTEYFVAYVEDQKALSLADFEALEEELDALILTGERLKDDVPRAVAFYMALKPLLLTRGHWSRARAWIEMLLRTARDQKNTYYEAFCLLQSETLLHLYARYEEAEQCLAECDQLLEKVEDRAQYIPLKAMLLAKRGAIYRDEHKRAAAEKDLREALTLWKALKGRQWEVGKVLNRLGALYVSINKLQEAEDALRESLEIYEQLGDMRRRGVVLNTLSGLYQKRKATQKAMQALNEALVIAEQLGDRKSMALIQGRLGGLYRAQKKYKQAIDAWQKTLSIAKELGDNRNIVSTLTLMGSILLSEDKFQDALDLLLPHLALQRKASYQEGIAKLLNLIGRVYLRQKRMEEAEEVLREGLTIARSSADIELIAEVFKTLAELYHEQNNRQKESEVLQDTIQLCIELNNKPALEIILRSLGLFYQKLKWHEQASVCYQKCFEIQEEEHSHQIGKTTYHLVHDLLVLHKKGLAQQYCERALAIVPNDPDLMKALQRVLKATEAKETQRNRLEISIAQDDTHNMAISLHKLGQLHQSENKIEEAEEAFLESLAIGRRLKLTRHLVIVLRSLGEIYALQGRMQEAEEALKEGYTAAASKGEKFGMAKIQETWGKVLLDVGKEIERAAMHLRESFALYEELQSSQGSETLRHLVKALLILHKEEEALAYYQRASTLWSGDSKMQSTLGYLQRKLFLNLQQSARKVGHVKRLIPSDTHEWVFGFIAPDDGKGDIYFKPEVVSNELLGRLKEDMRVWADIQMVEGRYQAIRVGDETELRVFEAEAQTLRVGEEVRSPANNLSLLKVLKAGDEKALYERLETAEAEEDMPEKALALYELGRAYQSQNRLEEAEEAFLGSLEIGSILKLTSHMGIILRSLGDNYALQGRMQEAEEALEESYKVAVKSGEQFDMASIQGTRGKLLLKYGEIERAATCLQESFALYEGLQNKQGTQIFYFLVRSLMLLHREEEAQACCQHAAAIWPEDVEVRKNLKRLKNEFSLNFLQQPTRKAGRIKRLIPAGLQEPAIGFITPDDGSQDIYFKQEILASDLRILLRTNMRVWADVQVVGGKAQAIRVGEEGGSIEQPVRKVGSIKKVILPSPQESAYGFIAPDDGSQDIYFKQEVVSNKLKGRLKKGVRVWAEIRVVGGKPQALRVGKEAGSSANTPSSQKAPKEEIEKTLRDRLETSEIRSDTQDEEALEVSYTPTFERGERADFDLTTETLASLAAEGSSLDAQERLCPNCGELLPASARFCGDCGTKLHLLIGNPVRAIPSD